MLTKGAINSTEAPYVELSPAPFVMNDRNTPRGRKAGQITLPIVTWLVAALCVVLIAVALANHQSFGSEAITTASVEAGQWADDDSEASRLFYDYLTVLCWRR